MFWYHHNIHGPGLVQPNKYVTTDPGGEVHFCLEVQLYADHQASILQLPIFTDSSLEKVAWARR